MRKKKLVGGNQKGGVAIGKVIILLGHANTEVIQIRTDLINAGESFN